MNGVNFKSYNAFNYRDINNPYAPFIKNEQNLPANINASQAGDSLDLNKNKEKSGTIHHPVNKLAKFFGLSAGLLAIGVLVAIVGRKGNLSQIEELMQKNKQIEKELGDPKTSLFKKLYLNINKIISSAMNVYINIKQKIEFKILHNPLTNSFLGSPLRKTMAKINEFFERISIKTTKQKYVDLLNHIEEIKVPGSKEEKFKKLQSLVSNLIKDIDGAESARVKELKAHIAEVLEEYKDNKLELKKLAKTIETRTIASSKGSSHLKNLADKKEEVEKLISELELDADKKEEIKSLLQKAYDFEHHELKNIMLELNLGSKLLEVMLLPVSFLYVGYRAHKEKTKKAKMATIAEEGFSVAGALSVGCYAAFKCMNGTQGILMTLVALKAFNMAGKYIVKNAFGYSKSSDQNKKYIT